MLKLLFGFKDWIKMSRKSPAFSFYPDSWIGGTMRMPPMQRAAYIDLLANQWLEGAFDFACALLVCRGVKEADVRAVLDSKFELVDGLYFNRRLEESVKSKRQKARREEQEEAKANQTVKQNLSKQPSRRQANRLAKFNIQFQTQFQTQSQTQLQIQTHTPPTPQGGCCGCGCR
jgi:uncharacterized protein YdaU (DUF1376 family)